MLVVSPMLGYIMKDNSEMWWNMGIFGYSESDCRAGLNLHCTYHNGRCEDDKTLLLRSSVNSRLKLRLGPYIHPPGGVPEPA